MKGSRRRRHLSGILFSFLSCFKINSTLIRCLSARNAIKSLSSASEGLVLETTLLTLTLTCTLRIGVPTDEINCVRGLQFKDVFPKSPAKQRSCYYRVTPKQQHQHHPKQQQQQQKSTRWHYKGINTVQQVNR